MAKTVTVKADSYNHQKFCSSKYARLNFFSVALFKLNAVHVWIEMCVCVYMYVYVQVCMRAYACVYVCVHMLACVCAYICACVRVCSCFQDFTVT